MWLLPTLFLVLLAVALAEHLHWKHVRAPLAELEQLQAREPLMRLEHMTDIAEQIFLASSAYGTPYSDETRRCVAHRIGEMREFLALRQGAPEPEPFITLLGPHSHWPFRSGNEE